MAGRGHGTAAHRGRSVLCVVTSGSEGAERDRLEAGNGTSTHSLGLCDSQSRPVGPGGGPIDGWGGRGLRPGLSVPGPRFIPHHRCAGPELVSPSEVSLRSRLLTPSGNAYRGPVAQQTGCTSTPAAEVCYAADGLPGRPAGSEAPRGECGRGAGTPVGPLTRGATPVWCWGQVVAEFAELPLLDTILGFHLRRG